jgi:hypothetical protein
LEPQQEKSSTRYIQVVEAAAEVMENEPKTSLRHLFYRFNNLYVKTCHTLLKADLHLHPYLCSATVSWFKHVA